MFELANPEILFLLPLPLIAWYCLRFRVNTNSGALHIPFFTRLKQIPLQQLMPRYRYSWRQLVLLLMWLLLVFAASGPQWVGAPIPLPRHGRDIMLSVDISGSMQIPDMRLHGHKVNRLALVKDVAQKFIKMRKGDRLGLILFGTHAYLQTPLTFDRQTVIAMLEDATIGLAGSQTALGDAIGLAIKRLDETAEQSRVLVLLTDGASNAGVIKPLAAAKIARDSHIKIYTIGLGSDRLMIRGFMTRQVINPSTDLDEKTLQKIAQLTGGQFFRARNADDLQRVYQTIDKLEPIAGKAKILRPIKPLYPWPLSIALILSILLALRYADLRSIMRKKEREATPC